MRDARKARAFALAAVAFMLLVAITPFSGSSDADGNASATSATAMIPKGDNYLYAIYTDIANNVDVVDVEVWNGTSWVSRMRTTDGTTVSHGTNATVVNDFWKFDPETGLGPFNTFYAAINLMDDNANYDRDDSVEKRLNTDAGTVAYLLNPDNLKQTLAGNQYSTSLYNVMLIIPKVFWGSTSMYTATKATGTLLAANMGYNVLYMSNDPTQFKDVKLIGQKSSSDTRDPAFPTMKAYAHSYSNVTGGSTTEAMFDTTMPYLGLGVYEGYVTGNTDAVGANMLVSQQGRIATGNMSVDAFNATANRDPASGDGAYQLWNFYEYTLYKAMAYTVIGSKNVQQIVGAGYTNGGDWDKKINAPWTGQTDSLNLYGLSSSLTTYDGRVFVDTTDGKSKMAGKLFLENSWGGIWDLIGDAYTEASHLYAGNAKGGKSIISADPRPDIGAVFTTDASGAWVKKLGTTFTAWDVPVVSQTADNSGSLSVPGDSVWIRGTTGPVRIGGSWSNGSMCGFSYICYNDPNPRLDFTAPNAGARLAYLMDESAVSVPSGYNVSYDAGEGSGSFGLTYLADRGNVMYLAQNQFKAPESKKFAGWQANDTGELINAGAEYTINGTVVFTAIWSENVHTASIKSNNNFEGYRINAMKYSTLDGQAIDFTIKAADGYIIPATGHTISVPGAVDLDVSDDGTTLRIHKSPLTDDVTITLKEATSGYRVAFDSSTKPSDIKYQIDGGSVVSESTTSINTVLFTKGAHIIKLTSASSTNGMYYSLDDVSYQQYVDGGIAVTGTSKLFVKPAHVLNFDKNNSSATGSMDPYAAVAKGTKLTVPESGFALSGQTFIGWATSSSGTVAYAPGSSITMNGDTTLFAKWASGYRSVTLNANSGTSGGHIDIHPGDTTVHNYSAAARSGMAIMGYTATKDGNNYVLTADGQFYPSSNVSGWTNGSNFVSGSGNTLYTKWGHSITYNMKGHGDQVASETVASGSKFTKPSSPTATGYWFAGWYKNSAYTGDQFNFDTETASANVTVYAKWNLTDVLSKALFDPVASSYTYTGEAINPVKLKASEDYVLGTDYTIAYTLKSGGAPAYTRDSEIRATVTAVEHSRLSGDPITFDFVISGAPLALTPKDVSLFYGDSVPDWSHPTSEGVWKGLTIEGWVHGESLSNYSTNEGAIAAHLGTSYTTTTGVSESPVAITWTGDSKTAEQNKAAIEAILSNYTVTLNDGSISISKATNSYTGDPVAATDLTYTGSDLNLLTTLPVAKYGTILYSIDGGEASSDAPKIAGAGTHVIQYTVKDTDDYTGLSASINVSVAKAAVGWPEVIEKPFNGAVQTVYPTESSLYTTITPANGTTVDTYKATLSLTDPSNYRWSSDTDGTKSDLTGDLMKITKAKPTAVETTYSVVYSGTVKKPAATDIVYIGFNGYRPDPSTVTIDGNSVNVGDATAKIKITGDENFQDVAESDNLTVTYKITKADARWTKAPAFATGLVYTGSTQYIYTVGEVNGGTPTYTVEYAPYVESTPRGADGNSGLNAGVYTVTYSIAADDNYNGLDAQSSKVTIAKAATSFSVSGKASLGYTGSAQELATLTKNGTGYAVQYSVLTNPSSEPTIWKEWTETDKPMGNAAGTYYVWYKVDGGNNYVSAAPASVTTTIDEGVCTINVVGSVLTYNTEAQTLATASGVNEGGKAYFSVLTDPEAEPSSWTEWAGTDAPKATNAGTYYVWYKVDSTDTSIKSLDPMKTEVTMAKAQAAWTTVPVAKTGLSYTGSAHQLFSNTPAVSAGTAKYAVGTGSFSDKAPIAINADTYKVYYKIEGNDNYLGVDAQETTVTIARATVLSVSLADYTPTYTGSELKPKFGDLAITVPTNVVGLPSSDKVKFTYGADLISAGTHTVKVAISGDSNFNDRTFDSVAYTVQKAASSWVKHPAAASGLVYTGSPLSLVTAGEASGGTVQYSVKQGSSAATDPSSIVPTAINAGKYSVTYNLLGDTNHEDLAGLTLEVSIAKATPVFTIEAVQSVYDGDIHKLVSVTGPTGGSIEYKLGSIGTYSYEIPFAISASTYTVYYKVDETANYSSVPEASISVTIAKATSTVSVTANYLTYAVETEQELVTASATGGSIQYSMDATEPRTWSTEIPKRIDAGTYTVYYKVVAAENYESIGEQSLVVTIAAAVPDVTVTGNTLMYSGSPQVLVEGVNRSPGTTLQYSLSPTSGFSASAPSGTDAKTYTVYYKVVGNPNFESLDVQSLTVTIAKAPSTASVAPKTLTYAAADQVLVDRDIVGGTAYYAVMTTSGTPSSWTQWTADSQPSGQDVGTYYVWYKVVGDDNHLDLDQTSVTVQISKAAPQWIRAPQAASGLAYTGADQKLIDESAIAAPAVTGGTIQYSADGTNYSTEIPTGNIAKTYTVYYKVVGNGNYLDLDAVSLSVTISKATPVITVVQATNLEYKEEGGVAVMQTLITSHSTTPTGASVVFRLGTTGDYAAAYPQASAAGTYTVYYKVVGNANFNTTSPESISVTIQTIAATITPPTAKTGLKFTGSPMELINVGTSEDGSFTYSLDQFEYSVAVPKLANAGTHPVYWKFTGNPGFSDQTGSVMVTILRSTPTITVNISDVPLGSPIEPSVTGNIGGGEVSYLYKLASAEEYTADVPTELGDYMVKAVVLATSNTEESSAEAEFSIVRNLQYTITMSAGANGTVTSTSGQQGADPNIRIIDATQNAVISIMAADDYIVDTVTVDGDTVEVSGTYTFVNVNDNHTISATFVYCEGASSRINTDGSVTETRTVTSGSLTIGVERVSHPNNLSVATATVESGGADVAVKETSVGTGEERRVVCITTITVTGGSSRTVTFDGAIETAEAAADALGRADIGNLHATVDATTPSGTSSLDVTIGLEAIANASLTVKGDVGSLNFDSDSVSGFAASGDSLKVSIGPATLDKKLSAASYGMPVYDVSVYIGSTAVTEFDGTAALSLPYALSPGEDASKLGICHLSATGQVYWIGGEYSDGIVSAYLEHLSYYFVWDGATQPDKPKPVVQEDDDDDIIDLINRNRHSTTSSGRSLSLYVAVAAAAVAAIAAMTAVLVFRKNRSLRPAGPSPAGSTPLPKPIPSDCPSPAGGYCFKYDTP